MNTNLVKNNEDNEEDLLISFPIAKKDLGNFVSNLLGQKQSLERTYPIDFEIDHPWLINLHECIEQRISQQAHSQLLNFSAVVYFEAGAKRTITTIESFRAYIETKSLVSIGVKIVWEYLVNFPNAAHPEKQQISLSVFSQRNVNNNSKSILAKIVGSSSSFTGAFFNIQIDHTERTWGDDVENVISSCVEDIAINKSIKNKLFKASRYIFSTTIFISLIIYLLYSEATVNSGLSSSLIEIYEPLKTQSIANVDLINKKIDLIFEGISSFEQARSDAKVFSFISFLLTPFILLAFMVFTSSNTNSYILLTKKTYELRENNNKKSKRKVTVVIVSYIASIITGIIATYGFNFLNGA